MGGDIMTKNLTRREFGGLVAGAAAASAFASVGAFAAAGQSVRLIWWGNPDRDRRTNEVIDLYMKETGTEVVPETYAWGDYWQKLATQAAGKNLPDLIQMDYRFIFEYARRQQLAALDDFVGKPLALDGFDPNQLAGGKVDGKLYGVSMGANSVDYLYNKVLLDKLGVELPDPTTWTIEDFEAIGMQVKDQLPDGMFFVQNMGYWEPRLEAWVRQRGKALYDEDGQLGYELADLTDFFGYWKDLQDKGLTPPADVQSQDSDGKMETSMLVTGKSLFGGTWSNQLVANQKLVPDEVGITMFPNQPGGKPGQYLKPSMFLSIAETSGDKEAAAALMNFFITDPKANAILQIERGVSGDPAVREAILPGLSPTEKKIIDYLDVVATSVGPLPPPPPKNAGELDRALRPAWDAISFEQVSVEDGAKQYYDNAVAILARA
jgi:multiple sugar transport system substrate-binding protein